MHHLCPLVERDRPDLAAGMDVQMFDLVWRKFYFANDIFLASYAADM